MSKHFEIHQLVPANVFARFAERSWWFIDPKLVAVLDALRDDLGVPVVINDWYTGGRFQNSGFRAPNTTVGAAMSQHRFGRAADVKALAMKPDAVLRALNLNKEKYLALGLTTIENLEHTPTWLHIDVRPRLPHMPSDDFFFVNP